jgi:DNA repair exonuclease SbcCD ATPase subunit
MLKLCINNFRCWESINLDIRIGSVTLIKGSSGIGKTTIFQAIAWCLYGNIRLVAPNHSEKAKTFVTVELPYLKNNLKINRQKNPNRLLVSFGTNSYEDKIAQSFIDNIFGNYDIWLSSCYIGQGCRNSFLTSTNAGKMDLLNTIAFHEEDPNIYIEKIDNKIAEEEASYKNKLQTYTNNVNSFQSMITNVDMNKILTQEQLLDMDLEIKSLEKQISELLQSKSQRDLDCKMLSNLEDRLGKLEKQQIIIPSIPTELNAVLDKIGSVEDPIQKLYSYISLLQRRDDLSNEIKKYDNLLLPYTNIDKTIIYSQEDYQIVLSQELSVKENQRIAQLLNVPYSSNHIKNTIQKYDDILGSQEYLKYEKNIQILRTKLALLEKEYFHYSENVEIPQIVPTIINVPDYSVYSTSELESEVVNLTIKHSELQSHLQLLQRGTDVIVCPHCSGNLRYQKGCLICADTNPTDLTEIKSKEKEVAEIVLKINKINNQISMLKKQGVQERNNYEKLVVMEQKRLESLNIKVRQLELEKQKKEMLKQAKLEQITEVEGEINKLIEKLSKLPEIKGERKLLTDVEASKLHDNIIKLSNINIIDLPSVSSNHIKSCLTYQDLLQKYKIINETYQAHILDIPKDFLNETVKSITNYINKFKIYKQQTSSLLQEKTNIDQQKMALSVQINELKEKIIDDPTLTLEVLNTSLKLCQESLVLHYKADEVKKVHAKLVKEHDDVANTNQYLGDLQTLKQYAVETECKILQQIVDSINSSIENVCTSMFDKEININLSMFKTMKTSKNVKPVVNFTIAYQGGSFDNINQLSGGETDRVSLSLSVALNRLSGCPLLMLDESLASLDLNMKEAVIKTLRENLNSTVIIIQHDGVDGVFDYCIDLNDITKGRF